MEMSINLKTIYSAALHLSKAERLTLARWVLESLERDKTYSRGVDLRPLMGIGKGLWGSTREIDAYIEKERNEWDG